MNLRILQTAAASLAFVATAAFAHDGDIDPSFGTDGLTIIDLGAAATPYGLAIDSMSRIVLAGPVVTTGPTGTDFGAARLTPNGAPDTDFSFDGWTTIAVGDGGAFDTMFNAIVQSDDKIVLVGEGPDTAEPSDDSDFKLVRLNTDGTLDTTFSGDGKAYVNFDLGGTNSDRALDAVQLANGKLIVVGSAEVAADNIDFAITRLNVDGTRDTGFGTNGRMTVGFDLDATNRDDIASSVAIDADGNILVAGAALKAASDYDFAIARLTPNGALDPNFGGDGRVTVAFDVGGNLDDEALELIVAPDGSIFVTGASTDNGYDFAAVKLQPDGTPDPTFGNGGKVTVPFDFGGEDFDISYGSALQADGKLVLAGLVTSTAGDGDIGLVRLDADGTLDDTFGFGGKKIIAPNIGGNLVDGAVRARIQNGYLVFSGLVTTATGYTSFAAGRVVIDTIFDSGFEEP
jgi:uncharacterized delta-60 repeat protein